MQRRFILFLFILLSLPAFLFAQGKVTLTPVAGPVYMLQGNGGNVGVIADASGVILIDAMFEADAAGIRTAIKGLPGGDKVRVLVDTHWHSDHTDGNKAFGPAALIVAQENVKPLLMQPQSIAGDSVAPLPRTALPSQTYKDTLTLKAGDIEVRLVHYPNAHTDGDTVVYIDTFKVVHMGDMFFNGLFPFLDVAHGGDIDHWVKQLDIIIAALPADAKIIPGHGPKAGVPQLKSFRQMLFDSAAFVRTQRAAGKTLADIKAAGLPESFQSWTYGFLTTPQWLELVYQSLEKNKTR
jgi:cyclase